jgi:RNA polymerase sigma-70 factor (ECF subfamily)
VTTPQPSDQDLLEALREGDRRAFETIFRSFYPGLLRFAHAQLGERADAEEAVQEVFLRIWRDRKRLAVDRSLRSYLLACVRNQVIDRHRRLRTEGRCFGSDPSGSMSEKAAVPASDSAAYAELDTAIRHAITALPERCRTAFLLCREQGLSYAEAAAVMEVSSATVKTQMARALTSLRSALDPFLALLVVLSSVAR